jgi:hypothetical protein
MLVAATAVGAQKNPDVAACPPDLETPREF